MQTRTLKKLALALTFWVAIHTPNLHAQLLGPYSNATASFEVDADGLLTSTGTFGTGSLSLSGAGTKMFWYPSKAAFRAGAATSTEWNDANIGHYSVALGQGTLASGLNSTALGAFTTASSSYATALGQNTQATGQYSLASGTGSVASGQVSTASNWYTLASGNGSTASGYYTTASAYSSFVVGAVNVGGGSTNSWVGTDPLFEVGNGGATTQFSTHVGDPSLSVPSDALVVYKNGSTTIEGPLSVSTGYQTTEGTNCKQGVATLSSGTITVSNTSVTANSRIIVTAQDNNSTGALRISARTAGTSFTIKSSNSGDSGVVAYEIFEPAP